jgi:hypothetical protein
MDLYSMGGGSAQSQENLRAFVLTIWVLIASIDVLVGVLDLTLTCAYTSAIDETAPLTSSKV